MAGRAKSICSAGISRTLFAGSPDFQGSGVSITDNGSVQCTSSRKSYEGRFFVLVTPPGSAICALIQGGRGAGAFQGPVEIKALLVPPPTFMVRHGEKARWWDRHGRRPCSRGGKKTRFVSSRPKSPQRAHRRQQPIGREGRQFNRRNILDIIEEMSSEAAPAQHPAWFPTCDVAGGFSVHAVRRRKTGAAALGVWRRRIHLGNLVDRPPLEPLDHKKPDRPAPSLGEQAGQKNRGLASAPRAIRAFFQLPALRQRTPCHLVFEPDFRCTQEILTGQECRRRSHVMGALLGQDPRRREAAAQQNNGITADSRVVLPAPLQIPVRGHITFI